MFGQTKKASALSGSFDGCDDDKIVCIKFGPCEDLLVNLRPRLHCPGTILYRHHS